ncbi:hypothetical protein [Streptomyces sp. 8N616]|uniref:hypothetical protein n=1 Tax=Streptomyces sp. 8N616 TaxID=3457414 RepID=UPI003FD27A77
MTTSAELAGRPGRMARNTGTTAETTKTTETIKTTEATKTIKTTGTTKTTVTVRTTETTQTQPTQTRPSPTQTQTQTQPQTTRNQTQTTPMTPTTQTTAPEETPAVSVPPRRADCIADSAGGLTFDLVDGGYSGAVPDSWDAALVLRVRGEDTTADEVRLPLVPAGREGRDGQDERDARLRAVLPSSVSLPEGRWDVYAEAGGGESERLEPGILDLRSLVDRRPDPDRASVAVRIPYATKHGNLTIRSWLRAPHAEAGEIRLSDGVMTVQGRLYGVQGEPGALAEARSRRDPSLVRTVPASVEGPARAGSADRYFAFTLAYKELAEVWEGGSEAWDLWLRPGPGAEAVRVARILDDVPDKKQIFTYPVQSLTTEEHGPAEAGPYYTMDNDLAVLIAPPGGTAA